MKKKYRKALRIFGILVLGIIGLSLFYPEATSKLLDRFISKPQTNKIKKEASSVVKKLDKVLGEKVSIFSEKLSSSEGPINIEEIVGKIAGPETVKEVEQKIENVVQERTEKIQKIPDEAVSEVKSAAREKIKQAVCEEWLKEE